MAVVGVRVLAVRAAPELERALQTPTREAAQARADEATYRRRAGAVEREHAIAENELQSSIELARREEQLVEQRGANTRRQAELGAAAETVAAEAAAARTRTTAAADADRMRALAGAEAERERTAAEIEAVRARDVGVAEAAGEAARVAALRDVPARGAGRARPPRAGGPPPRDRPAHDHPGRPHRPGHPPDHPLRRPGMTGRVAMPVAASPRFRRQPRPPFLRRRVAMPVAASPRFRDAEIPFPQRRVSVFTTGVSRRAAAVWSWCSPPRATAPSPPAAAPRCCWSPSRAAYCGSGCGSCKPRRADVSCLSSLPIRPGHAARRPAPTGAA